MRKTLKQQMDESLLELQQAQKRYEQKSAQYNEQKKKAQNRRIAERGAMVEKKLPEIAALDKKQFETYVEKVMLSHFARKTLAELTAEPVTPAEPMGVDIATQDNGAAPQSNILTAQNGGGGGSANGSSHTGQTSQSGRA